MYSADPRRNTAFTASIACSYSRQLPLQAAFSGLFSLPHQIRSTDKTRLFPDQQPYWFKAVSPLHLAVIKSATAAVSESSPQSETAGPFSGLLFRMIADLQLSPVFLCRTQPISGRSPSSSLAAEAAEILKVFRPAV